MSAPNSQPRSGSATRGRGRGRGGPSHDNPAMLPHTPAPSSSGRGGRGGGSGGGSGGGRGGNFRSRSRGAGKRADVPDPVVDTSVFDNVAKPGAARLRSASEDQANGGEGLDGADGEEGSDACFICTEELVYAAFGPCNHRTCHVCALRLRALYKDFACPFCKTEMLQVMITKASTSADLNFEDFEPLDQQPYSDPALKLWFDSQESYAASLSLLRFHCPDPLCDFVHDGPNGWSGLRTHVSTVHNMMLCEICTSHKHIFAHEHSLYPPNALRTHREHGDQSILKRIVNPDESVVRGHPSCGFCSQRFYDNDELYAHCRQRHEECFICQRAGVRNVYYRDYDGLAEHYAHEHFPCMHPECLEAKFVVFPSEIDLKAHMAEVHAQLYRGQQRAMTKEARKIAIDYHFPSLAGSGRGNNGSSSSAGLMSAAERAQQEAQQREREAEEALRAMSSKKKKNKKGKGKADGGASEDARSVAGASEAGSSSSAPSTPGSRTIRPPNSFGALAPTPAPPAAATTAPSSASSSRPASPTRTKREEAEDRAIAASPLLQLVFSLLGHSRAKLREFQSMSAAYMADQITAPEFVTALTHLVSDTDASADVQDVLDKIIDTCPFPAKRDALSSAARERLAAMSRQSKQQQQQQQRVLVIRSGSPNPNRARMGIPKVPGWTSILPANRAVLANTAKKAQSASAWSVPKTGAVPVAVAAAEEAAAGKGKGKAKAHGNASAAWIGGLAPAVMSGGGANSSSSSSSGPAPPAAVASSPIATGKKANKADFPSLPAASTPGSGLLTPARPGWGAGTPSLTAPGSSSGSGQQQGGSKKKGKDKQLLFRVGL